MIKFKKNVDLRNIADTNTQILYLNGMKLSKIDTLFHLFGKKLLKKNKTNNICELSLAEMGITDKHLEALDEDSFNFFNSMPLLKSLNLSGIYPN